jgi:hypothetical protein
MSVPIILVMKVPPAVILMVLSPVLVILDLLEMESYLVKVTIACTKPILTFKQPSFRYS